MRTLLRQTERIHTTAPLNLNDAALFYEDGKQYNTYDIFRYSFRYIFLDENGSIYNPQNLFPDSAVHPQYLDRLSPRISFKKMWKGISKKTTLRKAIIVFDMWSSNHYHFHVEVLPRLLFADAGQLLLPETNYCQSVAPQVLKRFGFNFDIKYISELTFIPRADYVSKTSCPGQPHEALIAQLRNRLKITIKPEKKIYVKRRSTSYRNVLNSFEVERILNDRGFETVYFEDYSYDKQVEISASAKIMVGMHGAGLTNIFYMSKGTTLIEFRRDGIHHNHCYWQLASALEVRYAAVFGNPDNVETAIEGEGCNLTIDTLQLSMTLDKLNAL